MQSQSDETLEYYDGHWREFVGQTQTVDFSAIQDSFLKLIRPHGLILDFGCGSGRDTKYFLREGYAVEAVDGSEEICRAASAYAGIQVQQMLFQDLEEVNRYDGIWACASILHLTKHDLPQMFRKLRAALKENGVLYASFKYGTFEGERGGRYFTDLTEEGLTAIIEEAGGFATDRMWETEDVRADRSGQKWINIILRKIN